MKFEYFHPADQLVMIMQRIYKKGLTTTSGGNLSIRDSDGNVWITPGGTDKGSMTRDDIVMISSDGKVSGNHNPSCELPFHMSVYKRRPDIRAVLHAHSPALVAFSIAKKITDVSLLPNIEKICGTIKMSEYALPGTSALGDNISSEFNEGINIVFMEKHGVCIGAKNIFEAFVKFETVEFAANLEITAKRTGRLRHPKDDENNGSASFSGLSSDINLSSDIYLSTDSNPAEGSSICDIPSPEECAARRDLIAFIQRSYRQGILIAGQGSFSVRLSDGSFVITPSGPDRAYLCESDLVTVKNGMTEEGKLPSEDVNFHRSIYDLNPDINSVITAQPLHIMAFAVTDAEFDPRTIPESYILLRDIRKAPHDLLYTDPRKAAGIFSDSVPALIFESSCIAVTGSSLLQAFDRLEVSEVTARSIIDSKSIGDIVRISDEQIAEIKKSLNLKG